MSELTKRILFAVFAIPLAVLIIIGPSLVFTLAILFISSLALYEYYKTTGHKEYHPKIITGIIAGVILQGGFYYFFSMAKPLQAYLFIAVIIMFASAVIFFLELWSKKPYPIANTAITIAGLIYIVLSFLSLIALKSFDVFSLAISNINFTGFDAIHTDYLKYASDINWGLFILTIFISVWICDSAAYFTGRAFGKHKLFPRHSPKKTWEGAIGGFVFSAIAFPVLSYFLNENLPLIHAIIPGIIIGIFGQIGDLVESQIKRDAAVKDSSKILPGHGGILDRFDSIIFVSPLIFIYYIIFVL